MKWRISLINARGLKLKGVNRWDFYTLIKSPSYSIPWVMEDDSNSCKTPNQQYLPETLLIVLHKVAKIVSQFIMSQSWAVLRSDTLTRRLIMPMVLWF